jgi:hypothetical protein
LDLPCASPRRAWQADLGQAGTQTRLPGDERRPAGGAALLGIEVGEHHAFGGDTIDVRGLVTHQPARVGADIGLADVVAPDDDDVGPARLLCARGRYSQQADGSQQGRPVNAFAVIHLLALLGPLFAFVGRL